MPRYGDWGGYDGGWAPYVPVSERRRQAAKKIAALQKKGKNIRPIHIEGRTIARTFWGKAWCDNLEAYSDFENRLPRGRTYVRNGSVIDLQIGKGEITALVSGSSVYTVEIAIRSLERTRWKTVIEACAGQIDSLVELLQGRFARGVMEIITCKQRGLFPSPKQITMECSCPDGAVMCKHVAAVLYGVGAHLDEKPELFFQLRNVDHSELITAAGAATSVTRATKIDKALESTDLSALFGIELEADASGQPSAEGPARRGARSSFKTKPKKKKAEAKKRKPRRS
ncbi:MAG: hypothetical protein EPO39_06000 [Candidatus Manganitrophaceae bacterium]|nr:MAG: hypothetical protein EPO39_06000 [Candidatus Manganitrophaceae bacterium]